MKIDSFFLKRIIFASVLFGIACMLPYFSSLYIKDHYKPPIVNDLLWDFFPHIPFLLRISEIIIFISVVYLIVWAFKKDINYIPYTMFVWFSFQILRAGLILLTPLGIPNSYSGFIPVGEKSVFAFGVFPSGHLAYPFLTYFITKRKILLVLTGVSVFCLIASRAHYSIDIVGAVLLGYCLYHLAEHNLKRYFFKNGKNK